MREAPNWLYERLPYAYVAVGALAASGFEWRWITAAGIALVVAGLAILRLRLRYRVKSVHQVFFRLGALR